MDAPILQAWFDMLFPLKLHPLKLRNVRGVIQL